jgi:hypothetical protein
MLHHSKLVVHSVSAEPPNGFILSTDIPASASDLLLIHQAAKLEWPSAELVDAALSTSMSYLKLVDVLYLINDVAITLDIVFERLVNARVKDLMSLQTCPRIIRDSPASDTATVYLNIADSVSGARAKALMGRTVQFGRYVASFKVARANPGLPLCIRCWKWGHPTKACCALRSSVHTALGLTAGSTIALSLAAAGEALMG